MSRVGGAASTVASTTVSAYWTHTAPWACLATLPVSSVSILPPISLSTLTTISVLSFLSRLRG